MVRVFGLVHGSDGGDGRLRSAERAQHACEVNQEPVDRGRAEARGVVLHTAGEDGTLVAHFEAERELCGAGIEATCVTVERTEWPRRDATLDQRPRDLEDR